MTQKDYIKFAAMIKARVDELQYQEHHIDSLTDLAKIRIQLSEVQTLTSAIANIFEEDNYKFNRGKFIKACRA